jgi:Tetratricopeptide repeat
VPASIVWEALQEALRIRKAQLPADDLRVADAERDMGMTLRCLGRDAEALPHAQEALRICKAQLPADDLRVAESERDVGVT